MTDALVEFGAERDQIHATRLGGARRRLARPRRDGPDRRGRLRHAGEDEALHEDKTVGEAVKSVAARRRPSSRWVVITGLGAVTPLRVGAGP